MEEITRTGSTNERSNGRPGRDCNDKTQSACAGVATAKTRRTWWADGGMKAYKVAVQNDGQWVSHGHVNTEFIVFAHDVTEAIVTASEYLSGLQEALMGSQIDVESLRIISIRESANVVGKIGNPIDEEPRDEWLRKVAAQAKKDAE